MCNVLLMQLHRNAEHSTKFLNHSRAQKRKTAMCQKRRVNSRSELRAADWEAAFLQDLMQGPRLLSVFQLHHLYYVISKGIMSIFIKLMKDKRAQRMACWKVLARPRNGLYYFHGYSVGNTWQQLGMQSGCVPGGGRTCAGRWDIYLYHDKQHSLPF